MCAPAIDAPTLAAFVERLDGYHEQLEEYVQDGNGDALEVIEARVSAAGADTRAARARARRQARAVQQ